MQTHLYRRGAAYYWRRLVPCAFRQLLGARDLRVSLETNLPEIARSRGIRMDAAFDLALRDLERIVRAGQVLSEEAKKSFVRNIRKQIVEEAEFARLMSDVRSEAQVEAAVAKARRQEIAMRDLLARNDLAQGRPHADQFLAGEGIVLDANGHEYRLLTKDALVAISEAYGIIADQERGIHYPIDAPRPVTIYANDESDGIRTADQVRNDKAQLKSLFSVHAEGLIQAKQASMRWGPDQIADTRTAVSLFIEFVGDKPIAHYQQSDATEFVNKLKRMPVGVNQRHPYIGISASDAIRKADKIQAAQIAHAKLKIKQERLEGEDADRLKAEALVNRLSVSTVIKYRDPCSAVFKHLQSLVNVKITNPFSDVRPDKRKNKSDKRDEREMYTDAQVRRIFGSPIWTGRKSKFFFGVPGKKLIKNHKYWIALIAALTGMRLEEICQLWIKDIRKVEGIWCIDIFEGPERQLKNKPSERLVPIPDLLIKLGFLAYVEETRKAKKYRVFPTLKRSTRIDQRTKLGKLGPAVTRSMGRYFQIHRLSDPKQLFHSFRHTFATKLHRAGVPMKDINDLMGHLQGGSESARRYIKRDELLMLKNYIDRVNFGFELVEINGEWHFAKPSEPTA